MANFSGNFLGTVGRDAAMHGKGRNRVFTFSVAIERGWGDKRTTTWITFKCWVDSESEKAMERATKALDHIKKGDKVFVSNVDGIDIEKYGDRADIVCWINSTMQVSTVHYKNGKPTAGDKPVVSDVTPDDGIPVDELDGEIPF